MLKLIVLTAKASFEVLEITNIRIKINDYEIGEILSKKSEVTNTH